MNHKQKIKHARRMMNDAEVRSGVSIFDSKDWNARKKARSDREVKRHKDALARKEEHKKREK